ncbi:hypothetical protein, partial [Burkholderia sp. A9]|uniref:hypothetical protein n=1 Tax=Burkholderia sp. A9 TaxID=1365108 RepID=UPI001F48378E
MNIGPGPGVELPVRRYLCGVGERKALRFGFARPKRIGLGSKKIRANEPGAGEWLGMMNFAAQMQKPPP